MVLCEFDIWCYVSLFIRPCRRVLSLLSTCLLLKVRVVGKLYTRDIMYCGNFAPIQ